MSETPDVAVRLGLNKCAHCGAVNADPRPWAPGELVCPDCDDRYPPSPPALQTGASQ